MPIYQFLLHTKNLKVDFGDGDISGVDFYTSRRASANSEEEARQIVVEAMAAEPKIRDLIATAREAGLCPETEIEEGVRLAWWRAILPSRKPGLAFYADEADEDPAVTD